MELFESMMLEHRKLNESGLKSITVEFSDTGMSDAPVKDATYSVSTPAEAVQEFLKDNPKYNSTAIIQIYDEDGNAWYIDENDNNSIKAFDSLDEFFDIKPDINLSLDASGQSVGFLGGKGGTVENEAVYQEDLPEDISEIAIAIDPDSDLDYSEEGEDGNIIYYFISPDLTEDEFISAAKVLGFEDTHSPTEILWEKSDGTQIEFYDDSRFGDPEDPIGNGFTIYGAKKVEESVKVSESKKITEAPRGCRGPGVEMFDEFVLAEYYYLNPSDQKYIDKSWDEEVDDAAQAAAREANNYSGEMKDGRHWTDFVEEVGSLRDLWTKRDEIRKRVKDAKSSGEIVSLDNLHNSSSLEDLSHILNEYGIDNYYSERLGMIELGSRAIPWGDLSSKDLKNVYDYIENEVYEGVLDGFQLDLDQDEEYGDSVIIRKENLGESVKVNESKKITEAPDMYGLPTDDEIKRQRSWYESDPYRKQIFQIADDFKKEFGIKAKTKYASYGFTREGDKEFRTYQVNLETGRDALRPLFIDGKAWMGLKPEYQGRFVTNSKGRKANWELEDGESQIEINPDYVIIQLRAVLDRDEAERQRNQDADDYDLAFRESVKKKVNESESSDEIDSMFDATWDHLPSSVKSRMDDFWSGSLSVKASAKWFNGYLTALVDLGVITEDEAANVNKMNEFYGNYRTESVKKKVNEAITKDNFRVQTVGFDILTPDENIKVGPDSPFVRKLSSALDEVGYELIDPYSFEIEDVTEYYNEDDLFFEESIKKKVNESVASDIYKEIKDKYPDVKIKIFSKDGRAVLRFTNYPGEGATGFGNDPRTEKRDNWKSFLQYVSKKHGGDPELDGIYPDEMNIWDLKEESVKKLKESKKNGSYYANKYLSRRDWYNIESDWEYKMNTGALSKLGWDDSLGKYVSPRSEVIKAYEQDFPRDQQVQNWADAIADQINDNRDYNYPFGYNKEEVDPDLDIGAAVYDYIRNIFIRDYVATRSSVKKSKEESLKESVADPREYDLEDLGMTSEEADRAHQEADDELTRLMDRMGVDANDAANHSRWSRVVDDIAYLVASCRRYDIEPYKYND